MTHAETALTEGILAELCADRKKLRMTLYGIQAKIQRLLCIPYLGHTETILLKAIETECREALRGEEE